MDSYQFDPQILRAMDEQNMRQNNFSQLRLQVYEMPEADECLQFKQIVQENFPLTFYECQFIDASDPDVDLPEFVEQAPTLVFKNSSAFVVGIENCVRYIQKKIEPLLQYEKQELEQRNTNTGARNIDDYLASTITTSINSAQRSSSAAQNNINDQLINFCQTNGSSI